MSIYLFMKVLQLNTNKSRYAHDALYALCLNHNAEIALVAEPNSGVIGKTTGWIHIKSHSTAIWIAVHQCDQIIEGRSFVGIIREDIPIVSIYLHLHSIGTKANNLDELGEVIVKPPKRRSIYIIDGMKHRNPPIIMPRES